MFLPEKLLIKTILPVFSKNSIHHCTQIAHNLCGSNLMVKKCGKNVPVVILNLHFDVYVDQKKIVSLWYYTLLVSNIWSEMFKYVFFLHKSNQKLQIRWGYCWRWNLVPLIDLSFYFHNYKKKKINYHLVYTIACTLVS